MMNRTRRRKMDFVDLMAHVHQSIEADLFVQQCSPIFTLYTHALHDGETKIRATTSWTRIFLTVDRPAPHPIYSPDRRFVTESFLVDPDDPVDNFGFSDGGTAQIDTTLLALAPAERGPAYLEWLHSNMLGLARLRGWDEEPLHQARQYCLDRDVAAHFQSPRRQSPDRQHKAWLSLNIDPDGFRHVELTVSDRTGSVVAKTSETVRPFFYDFHTWKKQCRTLAWTSSSTVQTERIYLTLPTNIPPVE